MLEHVADLEVVYKKGIGPVRARDLPRAAPYPYRGVGTKDALAGSTFMLQDPRGSRVGGRASSSSRCRARAASPSCRPSSSRAKASAAASTASSTSTTRCSPAWAAPARSGRRASGVVPDLMTVGKSLGGGHAAGRRGRARRADGLGARWAASAAPTAATRSPAPPACEASKAIPARFLARCARDRRARHVGAEPHAGAPRPDRRGARHRADGGDRAGQGPRVAGAGVRRSGGDRRRCAGARPAAAETGIYDNVLRILVPISAPRKIWTPGLDRLEESLVAAS